MRMSAVFDVLYFSRSDRFLFLDRKVRGSMAFRCVDARFKYLMLFGAKKRRISSG